MVIIRQDPTEIKTQQPSSVPIIQNTSPVAVKTPTAGGESSPVEYGDYLGTQDKGYTPVKKKGFFESLVEGVDKQAGEKSTVPGSFGNFIGDVVFSRESIKRGINAGLEFTQGRKDTRKQIENIRLTDPEEAARIEETGIGKGSTPFGNVVKMSAALGNMALTLIPVGLAGKTGRNLLLKGEAALFSKLGKPGAYILSGATKGASTKAKIANMSTIGGAYGSMYGFLTGLEEDADLGTAFKEAATYGLFGTATGGLLPVAIKGAGSLFKGASKATKMATDAVSTVTPEILKPGQYIKKLPAALQRAIFTENSFLKRNFGDVGKQFSEKYTKAYRTAAKFLGEFQDEAANLGLIKAPIISRGAYKEAAPLAERWADREFRFTVRDALTHEGQFADPAVRAELLGKDKYLNDVVNFFDKYRKDRGLRAQQSGITDNLLDVDTYFSKYTPQVPLSEKAAFQLSKATDDVEREVIYKNNSDVVDDMIEHGVRKGQWKTKAEGFKNYYDAMDAALNVSKVADEENAYFKWLVDNGHADNIQDAKSLYLESLDAPTKSLTPRAVSLDYERKLPMPWNDPDAMRVMTYYVKKADERLAMAEQFGVNDEVIKEMKELIQKSNMGRNAVENFEKVVRSITGQVHRQPAEQRMSALLRGIETFHLAFSQIVNAATLLNYVVTADTRSLITGLIKTSEKEGMRDAVKRGVFVSDMLRQATPYSSMGESMVDKILNYSGFTYTEMFNRAAGIGVSESWAKLNFNRLLESKGIKVLPEDEALTAKMMADRKKAQTMILEKGYENTGKYAKEFSQKFPKENFAPTAGNIGLAEKRLSRLEESIVPKIERLQKTKAYYEDRIVNQGRKLTDEDVMDLQETINILQDSIDTYKGGAQSVPGQAQQFSEGEVKEAVDGVIKLRRNQMQKMIADLEDEFDEVRALGIVDSLPEADRVVLSPEQRVAKTNAKVKSIDEAILSLQNELTEKERLLTGIIDGYKIADTQVRTDFPEGFAYDKFISEKKAILNNEDPLIAEAKKYTNANDYIAKTTKDFDSLPDYAKGALVAEARANGARTLDDISYMKSVYKEVDMNISDLKNMSPDTFADTFTKRGSITKGPIVVDNDGLIVDGNNRAREAFDRGDKTIKAYVEVKDKSELEQFWKDAQIKKTLSGVPKSAEVENLKELGIDVEEALARGSLSKEELTTAAQIMVEHTQGGQNPLMLPGFMRTPWGKVFGQFKTFAYMQANFIGKETMKNLVSKDTRSVAKAVKFLTVMGGAYPLTYGALRDVRDIITLKKDPEDAFELQKYWEGIGMLSAGGLYTDFLKSVGEGRMIDFAAGPTVNDVTKYLDATLGEGYRTLFKGEEFNPFKPIRKQIMNQTGVGQIINNLVDQN